MKLTVAKWEAKNGNELTANGLIRVNPNKPEYGSLMLIAVVTALSNGFMNIKNKVGFVVGRVKDLEALITNFGLKAGDDYSAKVSPHRIITSELLESEVEAKGLKGYREKINPTTGEVLTKDGETIMWKNEVIPIGSDIQDAYIKHDTVTQDAALQEFAGATELAEKR